MRIRGTASIHRGIFTVAVLVVAFTIGVSCGNGDNGSRLDDSQGSDDDETLLTGDDDAGDDHFDEMDPGFLDACGWTLQFNGNPDITVVYNPRASKGCLVDLEGGTYYEDQCDTDYRRFLPTLEPYTDPIDAALLQNMMGSPEEYLGPMLPTTPDLNELRRDIFQLTGAERPLEDFLAAPLRVEIVEASVSGGYCVQKMVFSDDLGRYRVLSYTPEKPGPYPLLVMSHGHGQYAQTIIDELRDVILNGEYAVLSPYNRVFTDGAAEETISGEYVYAGSGLLIPHAFEKLQVLRFAKDTALVDPARIGMIGHSGGATSSSIAARISTEVKISAEDSFTSYLPQTKDEGIKFQEGNDAWMWPLSSITTEPFLNPGVTTYHDGKRTLSVKGFDYDYPDHEALKDFLGLL